MNVYKVGADLAWGILLHLPSEDDRAAWRWDEALGTPSVNSWQPPRLENPRGKAKVLPTDCISACMVTAHDMLLSAHAREALASLLLPLGEFLPVQMEGLAVALEALDYCWLNCTTMADIADQDRIEGERSEYRLEPPDCWNSITRWSFHPERVATAPAVFTVPQDQWTLMCTDVLAAGGGGVRSVGLPVRPAVVAGEWGRDDRQLAQPVLWRARKAEKHCRQRTPQGDAGATERPRGEARAEAGVNSVPGMCSSRPQTSSA